MEKYYLLLTATVISIFISLVLSFFLLGVKTKHKLSNRLFAAFLILTTIDMSGVLFYLVEEKTSNAEMVRNLMTFLQLPLFYLYALSVLYRDFKLKSKHLIHLLPFIAVNLILIPRFYSVNLAGKKEFLRASSELIEIQFIHLVLHIQIAAYLIAVFMLLNKAKKLYLENYAGASIESFRWLFQLTIALSAYYFIALVKNIFKFTDYQQVSELFKVGLFFLELIIISWYLFKALNHPNLFRNIDSKLKLVKEFVNEEKQNVQVADAADEFSSELQKLKKHMEEKEPYLNPSLTIQDISDDLEITSRELSVLINHKLGQHFFDFINSYRIEHAKNILKDATKTKVTILEILYEVGFNSKSSFNTAFKKHVGMTPTEFRKSAILPIKS